MLGKFGHPPDRPELGDQPRRVPGAAAGQLVTFKEHAIGDADLRQMIRHRTTGNAAAHNHHIGLRWDIARHCIAPHFDRPSHDYPGKPSLRA